MKRINFTKMVASGNDFVVAEIKNPCLSGRQEKSKIKSLNKLAQKICNRKYGTGADGLLVLEKSKVADIKMRIFNADGSEAEMCGNGARCVALWAKSKIPACPAGRKNQKSKIFKIETKVGIIESQVDKDSVKIKLTDPRKIKLNIPIKVNNRTLRVNFINTGVPHTVIFVEGLDKIDVFNLGRQIRYHRRFAPAGTNVDFVEILSNNSLKLRTYERGVEDETLACGTGSVASALIMCSVQRAACSGKINAHTKSGEILKVYFDNIDDNFRNLWLEGKAGIVYKGEYYV